ncbi:hypothetical protein COP1_025331 [Malus domestica]
MIPLHHDIKDRNVRWVFLGCPGVGKITYASHLCHLLGVPHIATGDLVCDELAASGPTVFFPNLYHQKSPLHKTRRILCFTDLCIPLSNLPLLREYESCKARTFCSLKLKDLGFSSPQPESHVEIQFWLV